VEAEALKLGNTMDACTGTPEIKLGANKISQAFLLIRDCMVRQVIDCQNCRMLWFSRYRTYGHRQMRSGRLFLDRVGRHQSPSPLHRHEQINTHSPHARAKGDISTLPARGHFYFALTGAKRRLLAKTAGDRIPGSFFRVWATSLKLG